MISGTVAIQKTDPTGKMQLLCTIISGEKGLGEDFIALLFLTPQIRIYIDSTL